MYIWQKKEVPQKYHSWCMKAKRLKITSDVVAISQDHPGVMLWCWHNIPKLYIACVDLGRTS